MLSMTGHGDGHRQNDQVSVRVEVRTVNNRYFKLVLKVSEGFGSLEPRIEQLVRGRVRRGSVQLTIKIDAAGCDATTINEAVLANYYEQLQGMRQQLNVESPIQIERLLSLPGVIDEGPQDPDMVDSCWATVEAALNDAVDSLDAMRSREGSAMAEDLRANCSAISTELDAIEKRAPLVVETHRDRLLERVNRLLESYEVTLEAGDVIREIGLLVDRIDISEEAVRLRSHLKQFDEALEADESLGRKLDFLVQEMFRETNTIGSKANDALIAQHVVEIKSAIERIREMIQNIE